MKTARKVPGKMLENTRKNAGEYPEQCWKTPGKLLENTTKNARKIPVNCWKTPRTMLENIRKSLENTENKCWKIQGKMLENNTKNAGIRKMLENTRKIQKQKPRTNAKKYQRKCWRNIRKCAESYPETC